MSKSPKPRVVFELDAPTHSKALKLAKADRRKSVSAHAKVVYQAHLETQPPRPARP